jgi:hypothetical protein
MKSQTTSSAVQGVLEDYCSITCKTTMNNVAITQLESCLAAGQYSADKLKATLLTEESL